MASERSERNPGLVMSGSTKNGGAAFIGKVASFFILFFFHLLFGVVAACLVAGTIDVADEFPGEIQGPGLTLDEGFNIEVGIYLVESFAQLGPAILDQEAIRAIFADPRYNPDHPPLGRLAIGGVHKLAQWIRPLESSCGYIVSYARLASAIEFGLLVILLSYYTRRWFGFRVCCLTGISLLALPRLFAHAHLASLETCTCLMMTLPLVVLADTWSNRDEIPVHLAFVPGVWLGLALLTKIHAVLLFPVITVWALWNWRGHAVAVLLPMFLVAFGVFFAGWPWLWIDPAGHIKEYFASATERASLNCFYFGTIFADKAVPWHYPFVMFAATTPLAFLIAGFVGMANRTRDENTPVAIFDHRTQLFFGAWLLSLLVFAIHGVTAYDGIRLFLMASPFFAIFVGLGAARLLTRIQQRHGRRVSYPILLLAIAHPIYGMITLHPCQLSYYNELIPRLSVAQYAGFETTYWGDSVTPDFLERASEHLPDGATLEVAPVLHPLQLEFMRCGSWLKHRPDVKLSAFDDQRDDLSPYVLHIIRRADPWDSLKPPPEGTEQLAVVKRQGVVLTELLKLPPGAFPKEPEMSGEAESDQTGERSQPE